MATLEILSCFYNGEALRTVVEVKLQNIKSTDFWKRHCGFIKTDEKVILPPGASQTVKYSYKFQWDRCFTSIELRNHDDRCLRSFNKNIVGDDIIFKYEDTHLLCSRLCEPRNSLVEDLKNIKNFTITCNNNITLTVNKAILQARSPVFAAMFNSNFKEAKENLVHITDIEPVIVEKMIEFFENDTIKKTEGFELELYKVANKYQSDSFIKYARDLIKSTLTFKNTAVRLKLAMTCSDEELETFLCAWIRPNFHHICKLQNIFTHFTPDEICNLFKE